VIGLLATVGTRYCKRAAPGASYERHGTHEAMVGAGWHADSTPSVDVVPLVAGLEPGCSDVEILGDVDSSNLLGRAIVICRWTADRDRENAVRVARLIVAGKVVADHVTLDANLDEIPRGRNRHILTLIFINYYYEQKNVMASGGCSGAP
jgi:hypothetical protein